VLGVKVGVTFYSFTIRHMCKAGVDDDSFGGEETSLSRVGQHFAR
jgi:hypothetical protein